MAVVDASGKLVDTLSLRDLKGLRPDVKVMWRLWATVKTYKGHVREEFQADNPPSSLQCAALFIMRDSQPQGRHERRLSFDRN